MLPHHRHIASHGALICRSRWLRASGAPHSHRIAGHHLAGTHPLTRASSAVSCGLASTDRLACWSTAGRARATASRERSRQMVRIVGAVKARVPGAQRVGAGQGNGRARRWIGTPVPHGCFACAPLGFLKAGPNPACSGVLRCTPTRTYPLATPTACLQARSQHTTSPGPAAAGAARGTP